MEPPEPLSIAIGVSATFTAVLLASGCAAISAVPHARAAALPETLVGSQRSAWTRYIEKRQLAHARWSLLQAAGIALGVAAFTESGLSPWLAVTAVLGTFLLLSQALATLLQASAERSGPALVRFLYPLGVLAAPIADPVFHLTQALGRSVGSEAPPPMVTETEVEIIVTEGEQSGALDRDQSEMIRNVLEFGDTQACDLMVPRTQMTAFDIKTPQADLLKVIKETGHSRYPVYRDRIDNIVGILHLKDLFLTRTNNGDESFDMVKLLRKPVFVPGSQLGSSVLSEMRAGRHHMAIVIDEYGGISGLITLEDLLEEIVGDIQDEYDDEEPPIIALPNGHFVVDASVPIAELNRQAGVDLPDDGDYNSLGGFIVELMGRVPEAGAFIDRGSHRFLIKTADERHVAKVEIMPQTPPAELQASA